MAVGDFDRLLQCNAEWSRAPERQATSSLFILWRAWGNDFIGRATTWYIFQISGMAFSLVVIVTIPFLDVRLGWKSMGCCVENKYLKSNSKIGVSDTFSFKINTCLEINISNSSDCMQPNIQKLCQIRTFKRFEIPSSIRIWICSLGSESSHLL